MTIAIFIAAMVVGALALIKMPSTKSPPTSGRDRERRTISGTNQPFHAVSIRPTHGGCIAVEAISSQRFLSEEAPGLPLPECGSEDCDCRYIHHADRREGSRDRRLSLVKKSDEAEFWSLRNRRLERGRRQEDRLAA